MTRKTSTDKNGAKPSKAEEFIDGECKQYNDDIDDIIHDITQSGVVRMPWKLLRPLLRYKIDKILNESFVGSEGEDVFTPENVIGLLDKFNGPPFTIQRICELIEEPCKSYKRRDKYIRALQKNLLVVTIQEPDLIWMKVPNLSALLDPKCVPTIPMPISSPDTVTEKEPMISRDLPSPSWKLPRSPISPRSPRSPRSRTPPPDFESSYAGRNWEGLLEPHPIMFRKRANSSTLKETHSIVQLQEADSTVPDQPVSIEERVRRQKRHRSNSEEEAGILKAILCTPDKSVQSLPSPETETGDGRSCNESINSSNDQIHSDVEDEHLMSDNDKGGNVADSLEQGGVSVDDEICHDGKQSEGTTSTTIEMET